MKTLEDEKLNLSFREIKRIYNLKLNRIHFHVQKITTMSHILNEQLLEHVAKTFGLTKEAVAAAICSFCPEPSVKVPKQHIPARDNSSNSSIPAPVDTSKKEKEPKKKEPQEEKKPKAAPKPRSSNKEKHPCERTKQGQLEPCGKTNSRPLTINGVERWYCGTEASGCYKIMTKKGVVSEAKKVDEMFKKEKAKAEVDIVKVKTKVLDSITKPTKLEFQRTKVGEDHIFRNKETGFVINKTTNKVYGKFDKSKMTVVPLTEDDYETLEKHELDFVRPTDEKKDSSASSSGSSSSSSSESAEESESEESESEE